MSCSLAPLADIQAQTVDACPALKELQSGTLVDFQLLRTFAACQRFANQREGQDPIISTQQFWFVTLVVIATCLGECLLPQCTQLRLAQRLLAT